MRYEDNSQAGGIAQGQAPDARDDADALTAGTKTPAEGNVITGEGTKFGPMSSDQADGGHITKLAGAHGSDSNAADGKLSVQGEFGHLTMDAQGNYHYTPKANVPENSRDVFTYTLADNSGRTDTADLTIEFGKTPPVVRADAQQIVPGPDGVVVLPEGVQLSDVIVVGRNLVINLPDGTQMVIVDGAVFVPQLVLGGVEVPPTNLASLLIDSEPVNTGAGGPPPSSGGNFEVPVPPLDPGVPLGDLIPPTEMSYTPPEVQEVFPEEPDNEPTILIDPGNGVPVINAIDSVNEAGLPTRNGGEPAGSGESADGNGSNNSDPSEATTGTILYDSPDGVQSITITGANGVPVEAVIGAMIPGQYGTMFITDVVDGVITYRYVLNDNTSGDNTHDDFSVTITDPDGDQATATLQVNIVDDVPNAVNDTDSIAAGEYGPATGNVITDAAPGDAGDSDNGADTVGADNAHVTSISGSGGSDSSFEGGFLEVDGQYGTLRIYANGDYEYVRDAGTPGGVSDVFTYTLTDGDGDTDTATLTITIDDALPITGENAGAQLDDDALANGNPGGVGDDPDAVNTSGTLAGSGGDGPLTWALSASGAPAGFTYQLQGNGDLWVLQGGTHVLTVTLNAANGQYSVEQVAPIDHAAGGDENNVNFTINYTVSDVDGDSAAGSLAVNVDDDTPTIDPVLNREGAMTLDESLPSGPATIDTGAIVKGDDPDLAGGQAIGSASSGSAIVDLNASFGADGPAAGGGIHYELDVTNANSGLTLTDGSAINLVELPNGVVVGVVSGGAFDGQAAFAISIDPVSGVVTVEQYLSLDHPVNPDPNDPLSLGEGSLSVVGTATDGDGDTVSTGDIDISNLITFLDDGPSIDPVLNADATVTVDESLPSTAPTINLGSYSAGDDPDLAGGLALGHATSGVAIVDANAVFGADGPAAGGGIGYALSITNADSGLTLTDGTPISLVLEGGVIIGVVQGGTFDGDAAFAIAIDPVTGVVTVEQYLSLDHPVNPDPNDPLGMGENTVAVVVTATDGDGDPVSSDAIDISGQITFLDDGPTINPALNANATVTVDESLPSTAPTINLGSYVAGDDPDLAGGLALGHATSGVAVVDANAVFGADGPAAGGGIAYTLSITSANSGLTLTDGTPISLVLEGGVIIGVVQGGTFNGEAAFAIAIDPATGVVTVEQYLSLDHPVNPNPNDPLGLGDNTVAVTVTATDGDGDSVSSGAIDISHQITFLDDGPSIDPVLNEQAHVTVDESLPSTAPTINLGSYTAGDDPDLPGGLALGHSTSGVAVVDANAVFGADGPAAGGGINYTLSILNASSGLTLTDGTPINLVLENGVIVGVVDGGSFDGQAAFAIAIDPATGVLTVEQYLSLDHPVNPNPNDPLGFGENTIGVVVTATDGDGDPVSSGAIDISGTITFLDDGPAANNDVDTIMNGGESTDGNVITGAGTDGGLGGAGADFGGADGFGEITGVTSNNEPGNSSSIVNGDIVIEGQYGTLTLDPETGHYDYVRFPGSDGGVSDVFTYTLVDGDGDGVSATLTISIEDAVPQLATPAPVLLDDDALANGNPGGVGDDVDSQGTPGQLMGSGGDGDLDYFFSGTNNLPAGFSVNVVNAGQIQILQGATVVLTITLNNDTGAYSVVQNNPIDHAAGLDENNTSFSIGVYVEDADGDTATSSLSINVDDDTPTVSSNATVQLDDDALANGNPGGVGDDANSVNTSGTLGHSYGADGAGSIAYSTAGAPGGFTYQLQGNGDLWVMQGATHVLTLTVNATSGAYTVTQVAPIDHPAGSDENNVSFSISYIVTDHDGDTATGSILVNVDDDTPTVSSNATVQLDDDALANGNPGGVGDDANSANTSGTLGHSYGADGAGSIAYATTGAPAGFTYQLQGNGDLWVMQGATHVLTLTVNATSGAYTVTQVAPIDHPAGSDENNVSFSISYIVTDHDGDTATGSILVNVDDDTPTVSSNATVQLDDDALANGNPGGVGDDANSANTSGTLGHSYGADGAGSIAYATTGAPAGFTYQLQGNGDLWVMQGATHVLTLTVNATSGAYTVTQVAPIDHPAGSDENNVSFSISYVVTDHDGDTATGSILVNVDDDTPTVSSNATVQLDDDALANGNPGGVGDDANSANTSGTLGHSYGADGAGSIAYATTGAPAGFTYQLQGNGDLWVMQGATHVLTLTVNATSGAYTVTQVAPIDHPAGSDENNVSFSISYVVTDHDGDTATGSLLVNVDDDTPTATATQLTGTVDEDGLTGGIAGGTGDVPGEAVTASGNVGSLFNSGADTPLAYQLVNASSLNALGLTSGGTPLSYQITENLGIYTLTASAGGATIFTLTLNIDTGAYQFTLAGHLDHATGLNENDLTINLSSIIQASDHDGDVVAAGSNALIITVDDDSPINFNPVDRTDTNHTTATTLDDALVNDGSASGGGFLNDANANPANGENFIGADGFGSLAFSGGSNGDQLENSGGDPLTSGGDPILVTGYGTNTLTAYVESGANAGYQVGEDSLVFVATLTTGAGYGSNSTYNIQFYDTIDNGAGVNFDNLTSTKAGNVDVRGVGADDPNTTVDLLLTASANGLNATINTSASTVGAANQSMNQGETIRIDFVTNLQDDPTDNLAQYPSGFSYDGHVGTQSLLQLVPQVQGAQTETVAFRVYALSTTVTDAGSPDDTPGNGFSDSTIVGITEVTVDGWDVGETPVTVALGGVGVWTEVAYGVYAQLQADGSVIFTGIQEGDQYGISTGSDFNAVAVTSLAAGIGPVGHVSSTNAFDLGVFSIGIVDTGDPISLSLGVTATDADGDSSTGTIDITLVPDAPMMAAALGFKDPVQSSLSTNTGIVAGAAAAVGLAAMPLAAEQSGHAPADSHADMGHSVSSMSGSGISVRSLAHDGDGDITSMFASGGHALRGLDAGNDASSARALPDSSHSGDLAGANAAASAKDAGPQVQADHNVSADAAAASQAAPVVNMPSAAALQAAGLTGHAASGDSVGHVVAEALGLHDAPTVDGLLAHLGSVHDMRAAAAGGHDASGMESSVQGWDMGGHMAIAAHADVLMTMGNLAAAHHDAVPPAVNG